MALDVALITAFRLKESTLICGEPMYILCRYGEEVCLALHKSTVARWGNSLAVRIPRAAAQSIGLREGSSVRLVVKKDSLTIQRSRARMTLDKLLDGVTRLNSGGEIDFGPPVGREVW
jgi:antitoxin MazE